MRMNPFLVHPGKTGGVFLSNGHLNSFPYRLIPCMTGVADLTSFTFTSQNSGLPFRLF